MACAARGEGVTKSTTTLVFFFNIYSPLSGGRDRLEHGGWIDCGGEMGERATSRMFLRFVAFFSLVLRIDGYWATASPTTAA